MARQLRSRVGQEDDSDFVPSEARDAVFTSDAEQRQDPPLTRARTADAHSPRDLMQFLMHNSQMEADNREADREREQRRWEREMQQRELEQQQRRQEFTQMMERLVVNNRPPPKPTKLEPIQGGERIVSELIQFEQHMESFHVPKQQWIGHLRPLLQEDALDAYLALSPDDADDYDLVKAAILARMNITKETHMKRWWDISIRPSESATQMASRLGDLTAYCIKDCDTAKQAAEEFAKEHFLRCMPMAVACWVRSKDPATLKEAGNLCDKYVRDRNLDGHALRKHKYGSNSKLYERRSERPYHQDDKPSGTPASKPSQEVNKSSDQGAGKKSIQAPQMAQGRAVDQSSKKKKDLSQYFDEEKGPMCFSCNGWGHMATTCPKKRFTPTEFKANTVTTWLKARSTTCHALSSWTQEHSCP